MQDKIKYSINYEHTQLKKTRFHLVFDDGMDCDILNEWKFGWFRNWNTYMWDFIAYWFRVDMSFVERSQSSLIGWCVSLAYWAWVPCFKHVLIWGAAQNAKPIDTINKMWLSSNWHSWHNCQNVFVICELFMRHRGHMFMNYCNEGIKQR